MRKTILDACCGGKMFYFDKHDERVLFQDIRKVSTHLCDGRLFEVNPDIQADFTNMPYEDKSFSMVVFDPPHLLRNVGKSKMADMYGNLNEKAMPTGYQQIKYGALYSDWRDMLAKGFKECFRVLKPGGFLIFKWNETDIKVSEILKLTPEIPTRAKQVITRYYPCKYLMDSAKCIGWGRVYDTPQGAYSYLIDMISGKGTWDSNPYVFVYDFELVKKWK